jgi:predicted nucleic acid-binding protein
MAVSERGEPEVILCDTTFVSLQEKAGAKPETIAHWPVETLERLDTSILALSVFTIAELRAGRIHAKWGKARADRQEARLAAFLLVPLDEDILNEYAVLHAWSLRGHTLNHNDLWIAATAIARELPLVSCDKHHREIEKDHALDLIFLSPPAPS